MKIVQNVGQVFIFAFDKRWMKATLKNNFFVLNLQNCLFHQICRKRTDLKCFTKNGNQKQWKWFYQVWCKSVVTTFCSPEDPELYVVARVEEQASEYLKKKKESAESLNIPLNALTKPKK